MRLYTATLDCHDVEAQARWWAEALGWQIVYLDVEGDEGGEAAILPPHASDDPIENREDFDRAAAGICFVQVPRSDAKRVKNRMHLDFAPHASEDAEEIIERLVRSGATRVDVGQQSDATWTVLADPEGNEFCVLSPRTA